MTEKPCPDWSNFAMWIGDSLAKIGILVHRYCVILVLTAYVLAFGDCAVKKINKWEKEGRL